MNHLLTSNEMGIHTLQHLKTSLPLSAGTVRRDPYLGLDPEMRLKLEAGWEARIRLHGLNLQMAVPLALGTQLQSHATRRLLPPTSDRPVAPRSRSSLSTWPAPQPERAMHGTGRDAYARRALTAIPFATAKKVLVAVHGRPLVAVVEVESPEVEPGGFWLLEEPSPKPLEL